MPPGAATACCGMMSTRAQARTPSHAAESGLMTRRRVPLLIHLALVLLGLGYLVLSLTVGRTPDANIGAGLATLWLIALGSPWGWPLLAPGVVDNSGSLALLAAASALLNLGLHALVGVRRDRPLSRDDANA